ncbi:MAG: transcriptional repressor [Desulfovibrio sp.]|nr:MAG: transcriptional repressor [Desulfovibrio sp.]
MYALPQTRSDVTDRSCLDDFARSLQRLGVKQTRQRKVILQVFLDMEGHPSPEEIREEARRKGHRLGLATIYRTLKLLVDAGLARKLDFGDGQGRYERRDGKERHLHLICQQCGRTIEAPVATVEGRFSELAEAHSFVLHSHTTMLYGLCKACLKRAPKDTTKPTKRTCSE